MNPEVIRRDFPFFAANPDLVYLDNSATSQRPAVVLEALRKFYAEDNASPFRGLYPLSMQATEDYENAREKVARFIGAEEAAEIIFTRNASESLNLIAYSWGDSHLSAGDRIIVGITEHHSNFLPWQQLARRTGAEIDYWYCSKEGLYTPESLEALMTPRTRLVAITHMSNIFGRENDVRTFAAIAHAHGALLVADGAQSVPHIPVNVQDLDMDFLAFSGHKLLSPMGIGVLYGKRALLEEMPPFLTGGEMIESVSLEKVVYAPLPQKFEAGTVNTAGAIALGAAIDYLTDIGFEETMAQEHLLTKRTMDGIGQIPHISVIGSEDPSEHHGIVTFKIDGVHPHDISAILADQGIAIRAGHHCAQPLHQYLGIPSTSRASFMFYNTTEEVDRFLDVISQIRKVMGYAD